MKNSKSSSVFVMHKIPNIINISKIVTVHYFEFDKNFSHPSESHDFWEMVYVDSGEISEEAGNSNYKLSQGELIFHAPGEYHSLAVSGGKPANIFIITFVSYSKIMTLFANRTLTLPKNLRSHIAMIMSESSACFDLPFNAPDVHEIKLRENAPLGSLQLIRTYLEQILIMLLRTMSSEYEIKLYPSEENMENGIVSEILNLLEKNIYGNITVNEICLRLNYSRSYLSKLFNKSCNCTINQYYTKIKINEAKKLIRSNIYSFSEISDMLKFNNPHYFSRVFRRCVNMTPSEYKNSAKLK